MSIFSVIFMNFWGFDFIIFIAAIFNGLVFYLVKKTANRLSAKMSHTVFVPHLKIMQDQTDQKVSELHEEDVLVLRSASDRFYSLFVNITGIFPLLGILGTVVSLLGLVSDMENVTGNFYGALTSTFWGLIFAIIFKFLDGLVSPQIENNEKSVKIYLDGNTAASATVTVNEAPVETAVTAADTKEPVPAIISEQPVEATDITEENTDSDEE